MSPKAQPQSTCSCDWEDQLAREGFVFVAGVDEVGRGCLAGPVFAAAVILNRNDIPDGIDDSKKLPRPKRELLADEIHKRAQAVSIARVEHDEIDRINILQASKLAMKKAVQSLTLVPDALLIDALTLPDITCRQHGIIDGDALSVSIAAASIVAKVARDAVMREYAKTYPEYSFDTNVGYGTAAHWEALRKFGPTEIHRLTFRGVANPEEADNNPTEQSLF
ncbi:MAG TPA: ribonuclease HII [Blastocatellia bacterium]|nr:ribonuclease HII [Blastocatellia bacterium]